MKNKICLKYIIIIICSLFFISCNNNSKKVKKPDFLIGNWKRLNDNPENETYEIWNTNFTGFSYTKNENYTVFKEKLKILKKNDSLFLEVIGADNMPVLFKFKEQTDSSFVCENKNKQSLIIG